MEKIGDAIITSAKRIQVAEKSKSELVKITVSKEVGSLIQQAAITIRQKTYLAEMALGYLVSIQEGFIKDYLLQLLLH